MNKKKSIFTKAGVVCLSALLAIAGALACLNISNRNAIAANQTVDDLNASEVYGDWDDSYILYNCYAFALGIYNGKLNIGFKSNNSLSFIDGQLTNPIEQLADFTLQDLKYLGYSCVGSVKNWFSLPRSGQTLICVRKSVSDFHFMKYVDGIWLHKPGTSWLLKYNSTPNAENDWPSEGATYYYTLVEDEYAISYSRDDDVPYTGDIYFIKYSNVHNYSSYTYRNKNEHEVHCSDCGACHRIESHKFVRCGDKRICSGCNYILYDNGLGQIILKEEDETA